MLTLRVLERLFGFTRTVLLARLLSPNDFGVMGVALLAISALEAFSQTGFEMALIQKREDIRSYLDVAWTVQVARGLLLFIILLAAAQPVAAFFESPTAISIIRAVALVQLLKGLNNPGIVYFQRELQFDKQFAYQLGGTLVNLVTAVVAAILWRNAWALALGLISGQLVQCILSFIMHPYRPRISSEWRKASSIFGFGKWVLATNIIVFLAVNGDDVVLGRLLGTTALGLYQMAYRLANLVTTEITRVISQVTFPAYSQLQDYPVRLQFSFHKTIEYTVYVTAPITAVIIVLGPDFMRLFLGEEWMPTTLSLQILSIAGLIRSIVATGGPLFNAASQPHLDFWMNVARVCVTAITVIPLTRGWGLAGAAMAVLLGISTDLPIWFFYSITIVKGKITPLLSQFVYVLLTALTMVFPATIIRSRLGLVSLGEFSLLVLFLVCSYFGSSLLLWIIFRSGPFRAIRNIYQRL